MATIETAADVPPATADRLRVQQVLDEWVLCRDNGEWDRLRSCFARDGRMTTNGAAFDADEFVAYGRAARERGALSHHMTGPSRIRLAGSRALAETQATLTMRVRVHDVECDLTALVRYIDRFVYEEADWRILQRLPIYLLDRVQPVRPDEEVALRAELLARCPEGAKFLVYARLAGGGELPDPLPITFNTAEAAAALADGESWLAAGSL